MKEAIEPWIAKAEEDIRACKILLESDDFPTTVVCFHAQQVAEKYMKAFLTGMGIEFRKTHDLLTLLDEYCLSVNADFNGIRDQLKELTDYAIDVRYPGGELPPSNSEAKKALDAALIIKQFILEKIGP
jgi:HEPN domain-containing protein